MFSNFQSYKLTLERTVSENAGDSPARKLDTQLEFLKRISLNFTQVR